MRHQPDMADAWGLSVVRFVVGGGFDASAFFSCLLVTDDLIFSACDFTLKIFTGFFELTHALADTACKFRKFLGTEEEKNHDKDHDHFRSTDRT
jgi:hypothetical protein